MILSALTIAIVAAIAYIWAARGFFSALIHMLCVIVAGAIAFAFWEPVAYLIIGSDTSQSGWLVDVAWGLALGGPFALTLAILRGITNAVIRKNLDLDTITNLVGGGVCGAVSGTITAGIFVLSLSALRLETSFMGYQPVTVANNGSLVRTGGLLFPADRLTAWFYQTLSTSSFRVEENLARWHPNLADEGALLRTSHDEGKARNVIKPGAFEVLGKYTLEGPDVLNDTFDAGKKRDYTYLDGERANPAGTRLEGYVVRFSPAANEKNGRVVVGNAQLSLVVEQDGKSTSINPIAVVSEGDNAKTQYGRWPFDGQKSFIATFNGRNNAPMAFEFPVPKAAKPIALYVKGVRHRLDQKAPGSIGAFTSIEARDEAVRAGSIAVGSALSEYTPPTARTNKAKWAGDMPLRVSDSLPFSTVLQKDDLQGLEVDETKRITGGEARFSNERLAKVRGTDPNLQVRKFALADDIAMLQLVADGRNREFGFLSDPAANIDRDGAPQLVDEAGTRYDCYGFVFKNAAETQIRYTPSAAVSRVSEMPVMTKSQPNDQLVLLFRVGKQARIKHFIVGGQGIVEFDKPFDVARP